MKVRAAHIGRLWRTVRWLKAEQLWGRLRFRLQRPRPDLRAAPALRAATGAWELPARRAQSLVGPTRVRFLSEESELDPLGWDHPTVPLLWRYNLHYFDDLNAEGAVLRRPWQCAWVQRWCEENPPGSGTAWAPYPTSLRIVNWIKWFLGGQSPQPTWHHSLAVQVRWLNQRLEWHLLGNHLFVNAKALVFAGLYFEGAEAESWLATGLRILQRELPEQVLADGGQFERSPMYHALALEDLLDLLNIAAARAGGLARATPAQRAVHDTVPLLRSRSAAMLYWLRCMCHPAGALARFNDSTEGIAPATADLQRYAAALGVAAPQAADAGTTELQPSGYVRCARGNAVAFIDVAPIGPDYLPGHAHADTLSFELSVAGREIIVNRGTSVYGTGQRRLWERGTAAHNTVQIGSHDSSEVWSGFRVGRRARPHDVQVLDGTVRAWHDGYRHLPGAPRHQRRWQLEAGGLLVEDEIDPPPSETAVAHYHLAPGLALLRKAAATTWCIVEGAHERAGIEIVAGEANASTTLHAICFGQLVEACSLAVTLIAGRAAVHFTWKS